jgi:hypothetical protein
LAEGIGDSLGGLLANLREPTFHLPEGQAKLRNFYQAKSAGCRYVARLSPKRLSGIFVILILA